ncbi:MAG: type II secretion system protein GspN [Proteobacteria bacterium]|nr:type II secretion system protein GspN [Pseudomonadota bacterium]
MKIIYIVLGIFLVVFLTLNFWLSADYVLDKINENQKILQIKSDESRGQFLTRYKYKNLQIEKDGKKLLTLNNAEIELSVLMLLVGNININIISEKINGYFSVSINKKISGDLNFSNILFDTDFLEIPSYISFSGLTDGRIKINKDNVSIEFNINEINWRTFEIEGNKLPYDIFTKARGGIEITKDRLIVKSFGFEGERGYARLTGEIVNKKSNLFIEIFPKDFSDPYMLPFYEYKQTAGYYKIPVVLSK